MHRHGSARDGTGARLMWLLAPVALSVTGCPLHPGPPPLQQLARHEAIEYLNANNARITSALQAKRVSARGHFLDDNNKRHTYNLQGGILFIKPRYLYFDLQQLGQTVMRFGSNLEEYWLWIQPEVDTLWWGRHDLLDQGGPVEIPIRPDLLIEALGFDIVPHQDDPRSDVIYRVMGRHNQLLWLQHDEAGTLRLSKEYWLDRRVPHLIRKILSRDAEGRVTFYAELDDYRLIRDCGALAAHHVVLHWHERDSVMDLRIGGWVVRDNVSPTASAFRRPADRPTTICVE